MKLKNSMPDTFTISFLCLDIVLQLPTVFSTVMCCTSLQSRISRLYHIAQVCSKLCPGPFKFSNKSHKGLLFSNTHSDHTYIYSGSLNEYNGTEAVVRLGDITVLQSFHSTKHYSCVYCDFYSKNILPYQSHKSISHRYIQFIILDLMLMDCVYTCTVLYFVLVQSVLLLTKASLL